MPTSLGWRIFQWRPRRPRPLQTSTTPPLHSEALMVSTALHPTAPAHISGSEIPIAPLSANGTLAMLTANSEVRSLEEMEHEIIRFCDFRIIADRCRRSPAA